MKLLPFFLPFFLPRWFLPFLSCLLSPSLPPFFWFSSFSFLSSPLRSPLPPFLGVTPPLLTTVLNEHLVRFGRPGMTTCSLVWNGTVWHGIPWYDTVSSSRVARRIARWRCGASPRQASRRPKRSLSSTSTVTAARSPSCASTLPPKMCWRGTLLF